MMAEKKKNSRGLTILLLKISYPKRGKEIKDR